MKAKLYVFLLYKGSSVAKSMICCASD